MSWSDKEKKLVMFFNSWNCLHFTKDDGYNFVSCSQAIYRYNKLKTYIFNLHRAELFALIFHSFEVAIADAISSFEL